MQYCWSLISKFINIIKVIPVVVTYISSARTPPHTAVTNRLNPERTTEVHETSERPTSATCSPRQTCNHSDKPSGNIGTRTTACTRQRQIDHFATSSSALTALTAAALITQLRSGRLHVVHCMAHRPTAHATVATKTFYGRPRYTAPNESFSPVPPTKLCYIAAHWWTLWITTNTLCPKKVSPLNILQQPPQTCTYLNEILHTQDDIYFCHRRQIS